MGKPDYYVVETKRYGLCKADAVKEVIEGVKEYLEREEGWKPTGGIFIIADGKYYKAYQAIFKE